MNILLAFDGSDGAKDAVKDLHHAGLPARSRVRVLAVGDDLGVEPGPQHDALYPVSAACQASAANGAMANATGLAQAGVDLARRVGPGWTVEPDPRTGRTRKTILEAAEGWPADLLVVGSHGRGALLRTLLGSVSQHAVNRCSRSVRIGRRVTIFENHPPRIVVGTDGSSDSVAAVRAVAARTWPQGTLAWVVCVAASPPDFAGLGVLGYHEKIQAAADKTAAEAVAVLVGAGLEARALAPWGRPQAHLLHVAQQHAADCIFLGARGHGEVERFFAGSVASGVAAAASCSVEIVRPAA